MSYNITNYEDLQKVVSSGNFLLNLYKSSHHTHSPSCNQRLIPSLNISVGKMIGTGANGA